MKVAIVIMSCDLPARCLVLNMRQFNGLNGCHLCEDEGETAAQNRLQRWWPYNAASVLRCRESLVDDSIKATSSGEIVSSSHSYLL